VYEGKAWTLAHDTWLRAFRFERVSLRAAFDADCEGVQRVLARRNRLDDGAQRNSPVLLIEAPQVAGLD
jgi:transposase